MMFRLVPIVEGKGEIEATPLLIRKVLHEHLMAYDIDVRKAISANGRGQLTREDGVERFVKLAIRHEACDGVLILLDSDSDCAVNLARGLADRIRSMNFSIPTSIAVACREYEAWFLASLDTLCGRLIGGRPGIPAGTVFEGDVDAARNPKGWLERHFPEGRAYKETQDMASLTERLDLEQVLSRSRSFNRLVHAVQELSTSMRNGHIIVSPA